jgi:hypothetical protein
MAGMINFRSHTCNPTVSIPDHSVRKTEEKVMVFGNRFQLGGTENEMIYYLPEVE